MSYYSPSWRALQIKCTWRWRMLDQSPLIGPRWKLSRALRAEGRVSVVWESQGNHGNEWKEWKIIFGQKGRKEKMTAAAEKKAIFCVDINMVKRCLRLKIQWGLVPLAWEGLCSQLAWRALLKPAQWLWVMGSSTGLTSSSHSWAESLCKESSWEIKLCQKEDPGSGLESH